MKANFSARTTPWLLAASLLTALSACSQQQTAPRPAPSPSETLAVRPPPTPPPSAQPHIDWRDAPVTPGDWRWGMEGNLSVARFGGNVLVLSCNRTTGNVTLMRPGTAEGAVPMTVITASQTRQVNGSGVATNPPVIAVSFAARDGLLDAMAFSSGRFAIETAGLPTLYVPSWPEVSRVIEDCR
ncbi:MAG: hypothetical protein AB7F98_15140 [Novosphingobium sp.]